MNQYIGSHLEALRLSCGYSLREAAKRSGLSHGYIRDVELGVNRKNGSSILPQPQTLLKFAEAYGADYNQLMILAGHFHTSNADVPVSPYVLVEIELDTVYYVVVDKDDSVHYHLHESELTEKRGLHEYMLLEEKLESVGFLRIKCGVFLNLNKVLHFDEQNGRIYFDASLNGKFFEISWIRGHKFRSTIKRAIAKNSMRDIKSSPKLSLMIRNIVSNDSLSLV